jgi:photosystem II stability/assembly factor-like uncharacterized protein
MRIARPQPGLVLFVSLLLSCSHDSDRDDPSRSGADVGEEGDETAGSSEQWYESRSADGKPIPAGAYGKAWDAWTALWRSGQSTGTPEGAQRWRELGPQTLDYTGSNLPNMGPAGGRTSALAFDPRDPNVIYAGFALGGVWKSTDAGGKWRVLTDSLEDIGVRSHAVGAIAIDPAHPDTIYVGTGEGNLSGDSYMGQGILRSRDGGAHWERKGAAEFENQSISKLAFADGALYAAALPGVAGGFRRCEGSIVKDERRGLYRSTDDGETWEQLVSGKPVADFDVEPGSYGARILVSVFEEGVSLYEQGKDLVKIPELQPTPNASTRVSLTRAPSDPMVIYAGVGFADHGVPFRSLDGGKTWAAIKDGPDYCRAQCYYDNVIAVDPHDAETAYYGGSLCAVWKVASSGGDSPTWTAITMPMNDCGGDKRDGSTWEKGNVHPDVHGLTLDAYGHLWVNSDGGIARTLDGGATWERRNGGIATNQFYHLCVDPQDAQLVVGGLQDHGVAQLTGTLEAKPWSLLFSGDGTGCLVNLRDADETRRFMLVSTQNSHIFRIDAKGIPDVNNVDDISTFKTATPCDGLGGCGDRTNFTTTMASDPADPMNVYVVTHRVWRSRTGGIKGSWEAISDDRTNGDQVMCNDVKKPDFLASIAVAKGGDRIYVGSRFGRVSMTRDGGKTWADLTKAPLPHRWVTGLAVDPTNADTVYATFGAFSELTPDAPGQLFVSHDAGTTWERKDSPSLDFPYNAVIVHPVAPNILYVAGDLGVLASHDYGTSWQVLGANLPTVANYDVEFHERSSRLFTGTHARGAWVTELDPKAAAAPEAVSLALDYGENETAQTLTVKNPEPLGSILHFTVSADAPWLNVTPNAGTAAGDVAPTLSVRAYRGSLAAGTYQTTIHVKDPTARNAAAIDVPVTITVQ